MDKPLPYAAYQQREISVFKVLTATHKPMHTTVKLFSLLVQVLFKKTICGISFVGYLSHVVQVTENPL